MALPPEYNVEGKVFVAVGAGRGIGQGIVEVLVEAGAAGALVARTPRHVLPLAERLQATAQQQVRGFVADGTNQHELQQVVTQVLRDWGRIDIWINAVGDAISKPVVPLPEPGTPPRSDNVLSDAEWRQTLDINLTSIMVGCRAIGPYLLSQGRGRVINISSLAGLRGGANASAYTAAKAGVIGFTRALALEWATYGVTVNAIAPGSFPDAAQLSPTQLAHAQQHARTFPLGRVGSLREVGLLALYLASDASAYMTGQTICLDGGRSL